MSLRINLVVTLCKFHWLSVSVNRRYDDETANETAMFVLYWRRFYEFVFSPAGTKRELHDKSSSSRPCEQVCRTDRLM